MLTLQQKDKKEKLLLCNHNKCLEIELITLVISSFSCESPFSEYFKLAEFSDNGPDK